MFARVPDLDHDIGMLFAGVMVIVGVGFVGIVGVMLISVTMVDVVLVGVTMVGVVIVSVIVVSVVIVSMIIVSVVLVDLVVMVFFLHGGGHVPVDIQLDRRACGTGVQQNEIPHVVKESLRRGDRLAVVLVARRVLESDQVVHRTRKVHHDVRSLQGQLHLGRAVLVGSM